MAESGDALAAPGGDVFWSDEGLNPDGTQDACVPGVTHAANRRPSRLRWHRTKEVKTKIPAKQPMVEDLTHRNPLASTQLDLQCNAGVEQLLSSSGKKTFLKDLCIEDKQRVAGLIKELAKAGEEKDQAFAQLHKERQQYEKQILDLVDQQEAILIVQKQLFDCQHLLTKYQHHILERQKQLNLSFSESNTKEKDRLIPNSDVCLDSRNSHHKGNDDNSDLLRKPRITPNTTPLQISQPVTSLSSDSHPANAVHTPVLIQLHPQHVHKDAKPTNPARFNSSKCKETLGPLQDPIMSSTQKSSDLKLCGSLESCLTPDFQPHFAELTPKFSPHNSMTSVVEKNAPHYGNHIGSVDDGLCSLPQKPLYDEKFMEHYFKMKPEERKVELLRQRAALLEEQKRLRATLAKQEEQLCLKQNEILLKQEQRKIEQTKDMLAQKHSSSPVQPSVDSDGRLILSKDMHVHLVKLHAGSGDSQRTKMSSKGTSPRVECWSTGTSPLKDCEDFGINRVQPPYLIDAATNTSFRSSSATENQKQSNYLSAESHSGPSSSLSDKACRRTNYQFPKEKLSLRLCSPPMPELSDFVEKRPASNLGSFLDVCNPLLSKNSPSLGNNITRELVDEEENKVLEEVFFISLPSSSLQQSDDLRYSLSV